jgi:hypothetical protein
MKRRMTVSVLGLAISLLGLYVQPAHALSTDGTCLSLEQIEAERSQRVGMNDEGAGCQEAYCSFQCGLPSLCADPCETFCGPWGGYCGSECVTYACLVIE